MSRYAAFLRGMNVGGHRLTNDELRAHFETMGFVEVATFRASGNVVFADAREGPDDDTVRAEIEAGLAAALGYEVPAFIRSHAEVRTIAAHEPFAPQRVRASAGKLQVAMLGAAPGAEARKQVLALASDEDLLAFGTSSGAGERSSRAEERELYWLPSGGMRDSPLDLKRIDELLGAMTMRTKGTIELIARKHCG
jgi:uncharacterized protein (DUF1697 family)